MNRLLFLLLSAVVAVSITAGMARTSDHKMNTSHKATATKLVKATRATDAVAPTVPGQFHGWDRQVSRALRSDQAITWDFEDETQFSDFNCIDNDGDGFNWYYHNNWGTTTGIIVTHSGNGLVCSASYDRFELDPLSPDNWLISPEVTLGGVLIFYAMGQDDDDFAENFAVYVCVGTPTGVTDFVQVAGDFTTANDYREYEIDLSAYQGQVGHFAIVHHNTFSEYILNIDDITLDTGLRPHPVTPVVTVTPTSTTASVAWTTGSGAENWNLRYRPWVDTLGNPINCNFNDANYDLEKAGWMIRDADGDGKCWHLGNSDNDPANRYLYSESYDWDAGQALSPDNYLISPEIKLQGFLRFTYWGDGIQTPGQDKFMVYAQIGEEMHPLATEDYVTTFEYETETIDLNQFNGQVGHIVFRHYNCFDEDALFLDDIFIGDPDAETAVPAQWTEVNGLAEPRYTIEGLTLGTKYEVQVMAYNTVYQSDWSNVVSFTTFELGDVNHNGYVSINDVTALIDYLLGSGDIFTAQADMNGDNIVSIRDVTALIDYLLTAKDMVYTVVGPQSIFGSNWDVNDNANNMVKGGNGTYTWTKSGVALTGSFEFKVVGNHDYSVYEWPIGMNNNYFVQVGQEGIYDIVITFNPEAAEADRITCTLTRTGDIVHVYTVAGSPASVFMSEWDPTHEGNTMIEGEDGIYTLSLDGKYLTEGTDIYFKVFQDHSTEVSWPAENWWYYISETGVYSFVVTFNPSNGEITFTATKVL